MNNTIIDSSIKKATFEKQEKVESVISFDDLLNSIKPLGLWQIFVLALITYPQFFGAAVNTAAIFFQIN